MTKAVRGNVAATMGLALLTSLVCLIPVTALGAWGANQETLEFDSEEFGLYGTIGSSLPTIGSLLASIALTGFLAYVIGQAVLGRKVGIGETWDGTKRRLPALAGAVVLTVVGAVAVTGAIGTTPGMLCILAGAGLGIYVKYVVEGKDPGNGEPRP